MTLEGAPCADVTSDLDWFPGHGLSDNGRHTNEWNATIREHIRQCKAICAGCDYKAECLAEGFEIRDDFSIRAGFTGEQRKRQRMKAKRHGWSPLDAAADMLATAQQLELGA